MVLRAMYSGVSGLRAEGEALGVVGDNIANINTVGFKAQRAIFQDVLGHSVLAGTSSALPGSGVKVGDIQQLFTQGSLANTGVSTDVALSGDGFFVVKGTTNGISGNFFTRAGQFTVNKDGQLVNPNGMQVQGYAAKPDGTFDASISAIKVPTGSIQPNASTKASFVANLDSRSAIMNGGVFDPLQPGTSQNSTSTITVYDSLGNSHALDMHYTKTADNAWTWTATMNSVDLLGTAAAAALVPPNQDQVVGTGALTFNTDGSLLAGGAGTVTLPTLAGGAAAGQAITVNLGTAGGGIDGLTQYGSGSATSAQSQDGYSSGDFSGVAIDGQGIIQGLYTNGQKLAISQLAVAKFQSNDGLGRAGESLWIDTRDSGPAALGTAATGGRGAVSGGATESSNVDLAEEFVGLIQHQRAFSANSKTISTADEMLQELINIKR